MKRIGLIGGLSYESTTHYYQEINRQVNKRCGGLTSADLVIRSVNFNDYYGLMKAGAWDLIAEKLTHEALDLVIKSGCDYVAIASNTMHKVASEVAGLHEITNRMAWPYLFEEVKVPLIHIGDSIAEKCTKAGARHVAILGTKFTMTEDFLKRRLERRGLELFDGFDDAVVNKIDGIIFNELCKGIVEPASVNFFEKFLETKVAGDVDAIVLGCTELDMLESRSVINNANTDGRNVYIIDSTQAHIDSIVDYCLQD